MLKILKKLDWILFVSVLVLLGLSLVTIYSLSISSGGTLFQRQLYFVFISLVIFFITSFIDYRIWKNYVWIFYVFGLILLVVVFFLGRASNGAISWFKIGALNFQPVEFVKVVAILFLSQYFSRIKSSDLSWRNIVTSFLFIFLPIVLVILQPDMGSAMVLAGIWFGIIFTVGINWRQLLTLILVGIFFILIGWQFVLHDYQKQRVVSFLNPGSDPQGSGYNVIQAMVAIGSGGMKGKGINNSSQSQLNFIPEKHTDFIFATIAEENGLLGVFLLLVFFGVIFWRLKIIVGKARDRFGEIFVTGVSVVLFFQVLINIGMNLGVMPVAGLSLPFLSYGGSFLLVVMFLLGVAENVYSKKIS